MTDHPVRVFINVKRALPQTQIQDRSAWYEERVDEKSFYECVQLKAVDFIQRGYVETCD